MRKPCLHTCTHQFNALQTKSTHYSTNIANHTLQRIYLKVFVSNTFAYACEPPVAAACMHRFRASQSTAHNALCNFDVDCISESSSGNSF